MDRANPQGGLLKTFAREVLTLSLKFVFAFDFVFNTSHKLCMSPNMSDNKHNNMVTLSITVKYIDIEVKELHIFE